MTVSRSTYKEPKNPLDRRRGEPTKDWLKRLRATKKRGLSEGERVTLDICTLKARHQQVVERVAKQTKPTSMARLTTALKERVRRATVRLTRLGGQGVLVPGGFILTAAHCVVWTATGEMALGDHSLEPVKTAGGAKFLADVAAVEPRADLAVLVPPDNQVLPDEADAYEAFAEATEPIPLYSDLLGWGKPLRAHILAHTREWITGEVAQYGDPDSPAATLWLKASRQVRCGTSGSPVVNDAGELLGVVSWASVAKKGSQCEGCIPFACYALPRWLWDRIAVAMREPGKLSPHRLLA